MWINSQKILVILNRIKICLSKILSAWTSVSLIQCPESVEFCADTLGSLEYTAVV